jgi:hypothetical protein
MIKLIIAEKYLNIGEISMKYRIGDCVRRYVITNIGFSDVVLVCLCGKSCKVKHEEIEKYKCPDCEGKGLTSMAAYIAKGGCL